MRPGSESSATERLSAHSPVSSGGRPGRGSVVVIEPSRPWSLGLRELWTYRELLYFFAWRDVKVRYRQAAFGAAWAVLQPMLLMIVFSIFLGRLAGVGSEGKPYPVFAFAALVPWTLFASALSGASASVVGGSQMVTKVYFPRLTLPVAAVGSYLLDFVIALGILFGMMAYYGIYPSARLVWLPALVALTVIAALAVGIGLAAVNVRYRDVRYALPFVVQIWLFASPVAYPASLVPDAYRTLYGLNPMVGVIEGFRWMLLGTAAPPAGMLAASSAIAVGLFFAGCLYFKRTEAGFADVI